MHKKLNLNEMESKSGLLFRVEERKRGKQIAQHLEICFNF